MKKVLSLILSLLMLVSLLATPVYASADDGFNDGTFGDWGDGPVDPDVPDDPNVDPDAPNGTKEKPYPIGRPIDVPQTLELKVGACVYYQFPALKFNGWTLTAHAVSSVEVNGVMHTEQSLIDRAIKITLSTDGDLVGFFNESEEDVTAVLVLEEPLGTSDAPYQLEEGQNQVVIPEIHYEFYAEYTTSANGEYTFDVSNYEDFEVYFDQDRYDPENELIPMTEALTLELESGIPVAFILRPINGIFEATLSVTAPKKGTEQNPYWLFSYEDVVAGLNGDGLWPADETYYMLSGEYTGYPLVITGTGPLSVTVNGTTWTKDGTGAVSLEIPLELDAESFSFSVVIKAGSDVSMAIQFPVGHERNPLQLNKGQNILPLDEWGNPYFAYYTADKDGVLVMKPNTVEGLDRADAANQTEKEDGTYDSDFIYKGWEDDEGTLIGASDDNVLTIPVKAGDVVKVSANAGENEDFEILAMDWVLTVGYEGENYATITKEPTTGYAQMGNKVSVKVSATGDGLKYVWYYKNVGQSKYSKSSVTSATYSTTMSDKAKDRRVLCVITDKYGNKVETKSVYLREAVSITKEPATGYAAMGNKVTVKVTASGDGLKYVWYYKNVGQSKYSKSSVTSATYSTTMSDKAKDRRVLCVITDKYGNKVESKSVYLRETVSITKEPATGYAAMGKKVSVKVTASGDGLKYQWYIKNEGASKYSKSSVTSATYSTTMSDKAKNRRVLCVVTDKYGNKVESKSVYLREAVSLTSQPATTATAKNGAKVKVAIKASGDGLKYQWYVKNEGSSKYSKSSITSATYSATMSSKVNGRRVYCVVTDKYGNVVQTKTFILKKK